MPCVFFVLEAPKDIPVHHAEVFDAIHRQQVAECNAVANPEN